MAISAITTHVSDGLVLLLEQFKDQPNIQTLLTAFLKQVQEVEDAFDELLTDRTVDLSNGDNLDLIGRIVGQDRNGLTDANYRLWIKARIIINRSSGLTEEIYTVLKLITGNTDIGTFKVEDFYPLAVQVTNYVPNAGAPSVIRNILDLMRGACVDLNYRYAITLPLFRFDIGTGLDSGHLMGNL